MKSLKTFFSQANQANLNNCDLEQLHLSGAVQSAGAIFALDAESLRIKAFSENLPAFFNVTAEEFANLSFNQLEEYLNVSSKDLATVVEPNHHTLLQGKLQKDQQSFDLVAHKQNNLIIIDCLPAENLSLEGLRKNLQIIKSAYTTIISTSSFKNALQIAVETVRKITGFKRVQIYELKEDWSGEVIAETRSDDMNSYLGLHFPSSDIPKQARYLYEILPFRAITSTDDSIHKVIQVKDDSKDDLDQIDLSWSLVRSVSPMHTQYLRNMDVWASLAVGILYKGQLKSIMVGHHDEPANLPYEIWGMTRDIGDALMIRYDQEVLVQRAKGIEKVRDTEVLISDIIEANPDDLSYAFRKITDELSTVIESSGFALLNSDGIFTRGQTPPDHVIEDLKDWVINDKDGPNNFFTSTSLYREWPPAANYVDIACGLLLMQINTGSRNFFMWFREPVTKHTFWAGNPNEKKETIGPDGRPTLAPRHSFSKWVEEHLGESKPWTTIELEMAKQTLKGVLDVLADQAVKLHLAKRKAENLANTDFLTGLYTRRHFIESSESIFQQARRYKEASFSVVMIDIDHFKRLNDSLGHASGDEALQSVGRIVHSEIRSVDIAGRIGGEEFAICLPNTNVNEAYQFAERVRKRLLEIEINKEGHGVMHITGSFGVCSFLQSDNSFQEAMSRADKALYTAKQSGRNQVSISD